MAILCEKWKIPTGSRTTCSLFPSAVYNLWVSCSECKIRTRDLRFAGSNPPYQYRACNL